MHGRGAVFGIALCLVIAGCEKPDWTVPPVIPADGSARFSPDAQMVAFCRNHDATRASGIYLIAVDGTRERFLTEGLSPAWRPDGSQIAVALGPDIWTVDAASGMAVRRIAEMGEPLGGIDWSPDGKWITFNARSFPDIGIGRVNAATGGFAVLIRGPAENARWSPDGRRLAFVRGHSTTSDSPGVYLADSAGQAAVPIVLDSDRYAFSDPCWFGDLLVCTYTYNDGMEFATGTALVDSAGTWRPLSLDGACSDAAKTAGELVSTRRVYDEQPSGAARLFLSKPDGESPRQLTFPER